MKHIIVINTGRVQIQGSYNFIKKSDSEFGNLLSKGNFNENKDAEEDDSASKGEVRFFLFLSYLFVVNF